MIDHSKTTKMEAAGKEVIEKAKKRKGCIKLIAREGFDKYKIARSTWKVIAVPALTYANEVITYPQGIQKQLERSQREIGRFDLGANSFAPNAAIDGDMGWNSFSSREARSKTKYLGRLIYMKEDRYPKRIFEYLMNTGIKTNWTKRMKVIDRKYSGGTKRHLKGEIKYWEKCVDEDIRRVEEEDWKKELQKHKSLKWFQKKEKKVEETSLITRMAVPCFSKQEQGLYGH